MTRQRRWNPGKGFIKIEEATRQATWMKPLLGPVRILAGHGYPEQETEGGALLALYLPKPHATRDDLVEHWIIYLPRGCEFHWEIFDKPHRIRWLLHDDVEDREPGSLMYGVEILKHETKGASHKTPKLVDREGFQVTWCNWHRGHKTVWPNRRKSLFWNRWINGLASPAKLPMRIREALRPGVKELRQRQKYFNDLEAQWLRGEPNHLHGAQLVDTVNMVTSWLPPVKGMK